MCQMLAISMDPMKRPKSLTTDEPTAGLAPKLASEVFESIKRMREMGVSMIPVEQNARRAFCTKAKGDCRLNAIQEVEDLFGPLPDKPWEG